MPSTQSTEQVESLKKFETEQPVSNIAKAHANDPNFNLEEFHRKLNQGLVDNLNRNVMLGL